MTNLVGGYLNLVRTGGWKIETRRRGVVGGRPILITTLLQLDGDVLVTVADSLLVNGNRALLEQTWRRHLSRVRRKTSGLAKLEQRIDRLRWGAVPPVGYTAVDLLLAAQSGSLFTALQTEVVSYALMWAAALTAWFVPALLKRHLRHLLRKHLSAMMVLDAGPPADADSR